MRRSSIALTRLAAGDRPIGRLSYSQFTAPDTTQLDGRVEPRWAL